MTCAASINDRGFDEAEDLECCCSVLMVSNGAKINLEEAAAKELARLFLRPDNHAASEGFEETGSLATLGFRILFVAASFGLLDGIAATVLALMGVLDAMRTTNSKVNMLENFAIVTETFGTLIKLVRMCLARSFAL